MGRTKLDLPFAGTTFVNRVAAAARVTFDAVIAVQRAGGGTVPEVETIFEEPHDAAAPVFGVLRALDEAKGKCFILAVDYPLITSDLLGELRARFEASPVPMLVPMWRDRAQLLCAGYSPALRERIARRIADGRYDLRGLIDEAGADIFPEAELRSRHPGEPLMNVNTPDELLEAEKIHEQQRLFASR
jgi:molybdopterin-guanine dinucleotide biosynthesis protein A